MGKESRAGFFPRYRLLSREGEPIGVLALFSMYAISPEEDVLLEGLANTTAQVIGNSMAEEELINEKTFTESALDNLTDAFAVFDLQGRFLRWNRAVREITGYSDGEISEMNLTDFVSREDAHQITDAIALTLKDGHTNLEASVLTREGNRSHLSSLATCSGIGTESP